MASIELDPESTVKSLFVELFQLKPEQLVAEADISQDLGIDSIDLIDFLNEVNDQHSLDLELMEFENCKTIGQLVEHLKSNQRFASGT